MRKHWPQLVSEFEGTIAVKKSSEAEKAARRCDTLLIVISRFCGMLFP